MKLKKCIGKFEIIETEKNIHMLVLNKKNWDLVGETSRTYTFKRIRPLPSVEYVLQK
jgi:hypothetical protein